MRSSSLRTSSYTQCLEFFAWEIRLSCSYLLTYSTLNHQHGLMDVCFILWVIIQSYFILLLTLLGLWLLGARPSWLQCPSQLVFL